jgi:hypothetical protein
MTPTDKALRVGETAVVAAKKIFELLHGDPRSEVVKAAAFIQRALDEQQAVPMRQTQANRLWQDVKAALPPRPSETQLD